MSSIESDIVLQWGIVIGIMYPIGMSWYLWREWRKVKGHEEGRYDTKTYRGIGGITDPIHKSRGISYNPNDKRNHKGG